MDLQIQIQGDLWNVQAGGHSDLKFSGSSLVVFATIPVGVAACCSPLVNSASLFVFYIRPGNLNLMLLLLSQGFGCRFPVPLGVVLLYVNDTRTHSQGQWLQVRKHYICNLFGPSFKKKKCRATQNIRFGSQDQRMVDDASFHLDSLCRDTSHMVIKIWFQSLIRALYQRGGSTCSIW